MSVFKGYGRFGSNAGVIVTINTDDVLVFGQDVSEEFLSLFQADVFSPDELE